MLEAVAVVADLEDMAVVRQPVKQCYGQLWIAKHARSFREAQVRCDDDTSALVELSE